MTKNPSILKYKIKVALFILLLMVLLSSCSFLSPVADWEFVQSVGGIAIGNPAKNDQGEVIVPVECGLAGLKTVTVEPTTVNSGIGFKKYKLKIKGSDIYISIVYSVGLPEQCPPLNLGQIPNGKYQIIYKAKGQQNLIGEVIVE